MDIVHKRFILFIYYSYRKENINKGFDKMKELNSNELKALSVYIEKLGTDIQLIHNAKMILLLTEEERKAVDDSIRIMEKTVDKIYKAKNLKELKKIIKLKKAIKQNIQNYSSDLPFE